MQMYTKTERLSSRSGRYVQALMLLTPAAGGHWSLRPPPLPPPLAGGRWAGAGPRRAWTLAVGDAGFHGWDPAGEAALELLVAEVRAAEAAASACTGERARVVASAAAAMGGAQEVAVWLAGGDGRAAVVVEVGAAAAWARARGAVCVQVRGAVAAGGGAEDREAARCCASALRTGSEVRCLHRLHLHCLALLCSVLLRIMWRWFWSSGSML